MSKEKGEELFRALNVILDAITGLNLRDLEAEAVADRGESSTKAATQASKGKDNVDNPDWEDVPFNPVPITPLSSRPRFTQVVGSSCETPIVSPSPIAVASSSLAGRPVIGAAAAARMAMNPPGGGGPVGGGPAGGGGPPGGGPPGAGGGGEAPPPPLPYQTAAQFNNMWDNTPTDVGRQNLEQIAIARGTPEVQLAAMAKYNLRLQTLITTMAGQVAGATAAAALANANAANAQAVAQAAGNADRFRPAAPPKYGNKKKDADIRQWIPVIEDYLRTAPDADYIRLASSYLEGGPRSLWTSVYEAHKAANGGAEPPNPRVFFRQTLERNYGLHDQGQKHWDTWNSLRQGAGQDVGEYNVEFQQALTDLAGSITDEQVKIEKYRNGLQYDLRELCRTSPTGARWALLTDIIQYATLQWPVVQERVSRKKKQSSGESTKVAGKRKASGGGASSSGRITSKAKTGAGATVAPLSEEQKKRDFELKLCHKCHQPGHQAKSCPLNNRKKGGKVAAVGNAPQNDESSEEDF